MKKNIYYWLIWLLIVVFGITAPLRIIHSNNIILNPQTVDLRHIQLQIFFADYSRRSYKICPALHYIDDFLNISDIYGLDYRLLPALSIQESTCFEHGLYNNYFGIGSASSLEHYNTPIQGIERAAQMIIKYGLKRYGPSDNPHYPDEIKAIMNQIK